MHLQSIGHHQNSPKGYQQVDIKATDTKLTDRTIQIGFQKYAGYSPKELLRFLRFKTVVERMIEKKDRDVFEIILAFGYHDQSHLIKDFKYFLGITPVNFI